MKFIKKNTAEKFGQAGENSQYRCRAPVYSRDIPYT